MGLRLRPGTQTVSRPNRRDRWASAVVRAKLPASTRLFLSSVLAKHMQADGKVRWPREQLADELGISERTVTRHITRAKEAGWLMPDTLSGGHRGVVATYEASFPSEGMRDTSDPLLNDRKRDRINTLVRDKTVPHSALMRDTWCPTKRVLTYSQGRPVHIGTSRAVRDRDDAMTWGSRFITSRRTAPTTDELVDEMHQASSRGRHLQAVPA